MPSSADINPYLLRAVYQYCVDFNVVPYLVATVDKTANFPVAANADGKMVFNISPQAVNELLISNETVSFLARFSGQVKPVSIPLSDVVAIYESEGGRGIALQKSDATNATDDKNPPNKPSKKPTLEVL